jgi:hypothetical protein
VEPDVRMCDEKDADLLRLMSAEIVDDDVDFASRRLRLDDGREEGDKLIARMARHGAAEHSLCTTPTSMNARRAGNLSYQASLNSSSPPVGR